MQIPLMNIIRRERDGEKGGRGGRAIIGAVSSIEFGSLELHRSFYHRPTLREGAKRKEDGKEEKEGQRKRERE